MEGLMEEGGVDEEMLIEERVGRSGRGGERG